MQQIQNLQKKSFDYVIIGLVLHESKPILRQAIIREAFRVLKRDGNAGNSKRDDMDNKRIFSLSIVDELRILF